MIRQSMADSEPFKQWLRTYLPARLLGESVELQPVSGDAGFREYFRVNCTPSMLLAYAPPETENNTGFVTIGRALARAGVHTPRVYAVDFQRGYFIQEDLGQELYLGALNNQTLGPLYDCAEASLLKIQQVPAQQDIFPLYSAERLREELELFPQWFVTELLGHELSSEEQKMLDQLFDQLVDSALEQPQVVVHRDFHSRNLLVLPEQDVGVIDFQDAVVGPCTYDLVSLLRDCYVRWPEALVNARVSGFLHKAKAAGLIRDDLEQSTYLGWFDLMGLQRHIKVLGIFARLYLRDAKPAYLRDLPLVIRYTLEVAPSYPQSRDFCQWFLETLEAPLLEQSWYQDWTQAGEL